MKSTDRRIKTTNFFFLRYVQLKFVIFLLRIVKEKKTITWSSTFSFHLFNKYVHHQILFLSCLSLSRARASDQWTAFTMKILFVTFLEKKNTKEKTNNKRINMYIQTYTKRTWKRNSSVVFLRSIISTIRTKPFAFGFCR